MYTTIDVTYEYTNKKIPRHFSFQMPTPKGVQSLTNESVHEAAKAEMERVNKKDKIKGQICSVHISVYKKYF